MSEPLKKSTVRQRRVQQPTLANVDGTDGGLDVPTPTRASLEAPQPHHTPSPDRLSLSASPTVKPTTSPPSPAAETAAAPTTRTPQGHSVHVLFFLYASLAGVFGALSGVVGKLAVAAGYVPQLVAFVSTATHLPMPAPESRLFTLLPLAVRVAFFIANAVFTGQMWRYYIKSLSLGPTSVCQIINTGTNFAVSALCGIVLFAEEVNTTWAVGAFLVVLGLGLVVTDPTLRSQQ